MIPSDLDQRIQKAKSLGVPEDVIHQRIAQKYPDYHKKNPVLKFLLGGAMNVAQDIGSGLAMKFQPGYQKSQDAALASSKALADRAAKTTDPETRRRMMKVAQDTNATVSQNAQNIQGGYSEDINVNPALRGLEASNQIVGAAGLPNTLKTGARLATKAGRVLANPKRIVGQALERKVANAGTISPDLLEKHFGSITSPKPELYEGLSSAQGQGELARMTRREIATQGRSAGGSITEPTYKDIFNLRKGSYAQAKYAQGTPATPEQKLYANIGRAYDAILKEGAGTGKLDKAYSMLSRIQGISKPMKNTLKYILMYKAGEALINKAVPKS
jgi:hypothetical protein